MSLTHTLLTLWQCEQWEFYHVNLGGAKQNLSGMHASKATTQHNTKLYINCTIMVTNGAHKLSVEPCLAAKQFIQPHFTFLVNIADMTDLLIFFFLQLFLWYG